VEPWEFVHMELNRNSAVLTILHALQCYGRQLLRLAVES
jgi:hypothetical protein